jgi:tetratricopeptide (TPR) repeat protein
MHNIPCRQRAAELCEEALFKDPPPKEDCPICFLPMPVQLICCISLPSATITSVPIYDFATANTELATEPMEKYYPCCRKSICNGCAYSNIKSGSKIKCPFCNSEQEGKTEEERVQEMMRRVEANDAASIFLLACNYHHGYNGLQQDQTKAKELYTRAADLGCSQAHCNLGNIYHKGGDLKKAKFHCEAAAMIGHNNVARNNLGVIEAESGNIERAVKHWTIAASAGDYQAMFTLLIALKKRDVSSESIDSTLVAYNNSCTEMRSEARDAYIQFEIDRI